MITPESSMLAPERAALREPEGAAVATAADAPERAWSLAPEGDTVTALDSVIAPE